MVSAIINHPQKTQKNHFDVFRYSLVPVLIARGSAVLFNLSLLTADVYSFVIGRLPRLRIRGASPLALSSPALSSLQHPSRAVRCALPRLRVLVRIAGRWLILQSCNLIGFLPTLSAPPGILFLKIEFYWLYFPAFFTVLAGIAIYTRAPDHRGDAATATASQTVTSAPVHHK